MQIIELTNGTNGKVSHHARIRDARAVVTRLKALGPKNAKELLGESPADIVISCCTVKGQGKGKILALLSGDTSQWCDERAVVETYRASLIPDAKKDEPSVKLVRFVEREV